MDTKETIQAHLGARRILEASVDQDESLCIIGSTDVDQEYYNVLLSTADELGIETTMGLMFPRTTYGKQAPRPLEAQALASDVTLMTPSTSLGHTSTALKILEAGKKAVTFPASPVPSRQLSVLRKQRIYDDAKLREIKDLTMRCSDVFTDGAEVEITSPAGTDLHARIDGRTAHPWYGLLDADCFYYATWPPGDAHVSAIEDSANGVAIVDGYIGGIGVPDEPLKLEFEDGQMTNVEGKDADKIVAALENSDENARTFAEVGLGTNPWQEQTGSNGDKYITGTFHFALGASATPCFGGVDYDGLVESDFHSDFQIMDPVTVTVDGEEIVRDGEILV